MRVITPGGQIEERALQDRTRHWNMLETRPFVCSIHIAWHLICTNWVGNADDAGHPCLDSTTQPSSSASACHVLPDYRSMRLIRAYGDPELRSPGTFGIYL
eukprot:6189661-Pleurochrysis_carterae.AAC.6